MDSQHTNFAELINKVRARIRMRKALKGTAITVAVAALSLLAAGAAASYFGPRSNMLIALRILPIVLIAAAGWFFLFRPLRRRMSDVQIAQLIEEKGRLGERLVTAVEYSEDMRSASPAIVDRLVKDTSERCSDVTLNNVVDPRRSYAYGAGSALALVALVAAFFMGPSAITGGLSALYSPLGGMASANSMFISVDPGTARAPRGSDQKIKATLNGFDSEIAQVFVRKFGTESWVANTMEPAKNQDEFQYLIFNIQDSVTYYVEANGIRSPEFTLEVADLPFVKQIDLVLNFPAYTRLPSKKIEKGGEVATLKGTRIQVIAFLSAQAKSARILMHDGSKIEMVPGSDNQFTGEFTVKENGSYRIELTDMEGETYNGSNEFDITVLEDHPPTVVIDKPGRDMKVTSIQEIFSQARAEDDYGVSSIELYFSVNGGEEKRVQLQDIKSESPRTLSGAHTFFLEEFGLQPGDFISYYAKARDNGADGGRESTSDMYFLEVRPFDRSFRQAQQQGGGGGEGEGDSSALTRRQRQVIAATFRVQREQKDYTPQEKEENFGAVTLSQERLKSDTDVLAERIRRRLGEQLESQPEFSKLVECLTQAAKEMEAAVNELRAQKTKEALQPEQRALQQLLRAEAIFRDIQIAQGGGQGGGGGSQNAQDLADLFELQLDKMKNQYETIQSQQQSNQAQQQDEIARRLEELARRQQQQLEQRMRSQQQQQGGGGGSQRQQQEMIEEAQRMARELERLSRERRDPQLAQAAREMQRAADEMQRAQASSSSQNSNEATAQSLRALDRLEQARKTLDSSRQQGGQQNAQQLRQRAEEALKRQEEITRSVDQLARSGQSGQGKEQQKEQLAERKEALADQIAGLEKDIDQAARGMGQDSRQAGDKMREAANAIRRNRIPDRIRQNNELIENEWYDQARDRERTIRGNIEEVLKNLQAAERGASQRAQGDSLEESLNRARELADNLESLRRRGEAGSQQGQQGNQQQQQGGQQQGQQANQQQGQQGNQQGQQRGQQGQQAQNQQGQQGQQSGQQARNQQQGQQGQQQGQQGQQQGQRQGQQGQQGQQQGQQGGQQAGGQQQGGQQQNGQQQGGRIADASDPRMGGGPVGPNSRQVESELRQRVAEAEELRRQLGRNSELARELNDVIEQLRRIDPNAFSDPAQLDLLKNEVIDPLRQLELALARKLQAKLGNNGSGAFSDGDAPDRYRKMIEEYYRRLSMRSPDAPRDK